jgi:hypothetical protein
MEYLKMKITEVNCETGEVIIREPNEQEIVQAQKDLESYEKNMAALQAKETEKTLVLERLGLTADDLKALGL